MSLSNTAPVERHAGAERARLAFILLAAALSFALLRAWPLIRPATAARTPPTNPILAPMDPVRRPATPGDPETSSSTPRITDEADSEDTHAAGATERPAPLGLGFVVWESNRTGEWRLWRRELDRTGLRRLTPDDDKAHCCAHISPDGKRIAYLRYRPEQKRGDERPPPIAELHLMHSDGSDDRILKTPVRLPSESRAVTWLDDNALLYVDADGHTQRLDLTTGATTRLTRDPHPRDGWLMNPTLDHATTAWVTFSPFDAETLAIAERRTLGGCQPYFSSDGHWGFWVAGAGGPINRIDLASREVSTILHKNDPAMPADRGYLYFPMLSRDGRLFAFGASPGEHDFARSNYDIFVTETDPSTLEPFGRPRRLTDNPASDRFPDVFAEPLALGDHTGEAPFTVALSPPRPDPADPTHWTWDLGNGSVIEGPEAHHVYRSPGRFEVTAKRGDTVLRGRVTVAPARPPRPVSSRLEGERTLRVTFDEVVQFDDVRLALGSGRTISSWRAGSDGRSLVVELLEPMVESDRLRISGVRDRAQRPNLMAATEVSIPAPSWPSDSEGLIFLWQTGDSANLLYDSTIGAMRTYGLAPRGRARLDHAFRMQVGRGAFVATEEAAERLAQVGRDGNQLTIELVLAPSRATTSDRADILSFSARPPERRNMSLYQSGRALYFEMRGHSVGLGEIADRSPRHLVVTCSPGQLHAYFDGVEVRESAELQEDLSRWRRRPLVFGSGPWGGHDWSGTLEGIALYGRVLDAVEVAENARRYHRLLTERAPVPQQRIRAVLRRRSEIPTLDEIAPYRQALVVYEYHPVSGAGTAEVIRVVHWAILDGEVQPIATLRTGEEAVLLLEPFAANVQLESLFLGDDLPPRADLDLYFDAGS